MSKVISRRGFLKRAPVAAVVAGTPITMAIAEGRADPVEDGEMKCMRLARELFNAMKAHYGEDCQMIRDERHGTLTFAQPPGTGRTVEFTGPGWYEVEEDGPDRIEVMWLEDSGYPVRPKRGRFIKATPQDPTLQTRYYEESWLRKITVRKIGIV
jgi:hypothetical protein